jgi:hypothetical protein
VLVGRTPSRFVVSIHVVVPDPRATAPRVPATRDEALLDICSRALLTRNGSPSALQACRRAAAAADLTGDPIARQMAYKVAAAAFRQSLAAHPEHETEHAAALRDVLAFHAIIKNRAGDYAGQAALNRQAEQFASYR